MLELEYRFFESPLGKLLLAGREETLYYIGFCPDSEKALGHLASKVDIKKNPRVCSLASKQLDHYFKGQLKRFEIEIDLQLTSEFQKNKLLPSLQQISYGELTTYGKLAAMCGIPQGARAIGQALHSNPIPIVFPCHRVIQSSGHWGGYAGGIDNKRWLLKHEGSVLL